MGPHLFRQFIHVLGFGFNIDIHKKAKISFFHREIGDERLSLVNVINHENRRRPCAPRAKHITELDATAATKNEVRHDSKISVHKASIEPGGDGFCLFESIPRRNTRKGKGTGLRCRRNLGY
jgi:hypothetical protein